MSNTKDEYIYRSTNESDDKITLVGRVYYQNGFYNFYPTRKIVNNFITWLDDKDKHILLSTYKNITINVDVSKEHNSEIKTKVNEFALKVKSSSGVGCVISFFKSDLLMTISNGFVRKKQYKSLQLSKLLNYKENNEIICEDRFYCIIKNNQLIENYSFKELQENTNINLTPRHLLPKAKKYFIIFEKESHEKSINDDYKYIGPFEFGNNGKLHRTGMEEIYSDRYLIKDGNGKTYIYWDYNMFNDKPTNHDAIIENDKFSNRVLSSDDFFVFISYRSTDKDIAYETKNILKQNGIDAWMAPESIPAGSDYGSEIPKALKLCSAFVILLSKDAQNSKWIPKEIDGAVNNGKIIIPFKIDDADISEPFNFRLGDSQRIEAYQRMSDAYSELVKRLQEILPLNNNSMSTNAEKGLSLQEKEFILKNRTDLRIENHTIPEMCSYSDEYIPTGMFEFIEEKIDLENIDPDKDVFLGFSFEIDFSNQIKDGINQLYIGFENFAQIFNTECRLYFDPPENLFPLNISNNETSSITLNFVCRKLINDDDMLEDVMENFKKESPIILLNVYVTNGFVDERFEFDAILNFIGDAMSRSFEKNDVHYKISK